MFLFPIQLLRILQEGLRYILNRPFFPQRLIFIPVQESVFNRLQFNHLGAIIFEGEIRKITIALIKMFPNSKVVFFNLSKMFRRKLFFCECRFEKYFLGCSPFQQCLMLRHTRGFLMCSIRSPFQFILAI